MIPVFKISCSQIGKIMTEPRTKAAKDAGELSETAKTYCEEWLKEQLYGRRKEITSKYTNKGNETEIDAMDYAAHELGWGFVTKNKIRKSSKFIEGECDVVLVDSIKDIKSSWDCFTFPLFETEIPEKDYKYQIQGYCELWGKPRGSVVYCLMDMPEDLISKEVRYRLGEEYTEDQYNAFIAKFKYSHLPANLRLKEFEIEADKEEIKRIEERVVKCREYIDGLLQTGAFSKQEVKLNKSRRAA